jgi:hypothetical protein
MIYAYSLDNRLLPWVSEVLVTLGATNDEVMRKKYRSLQQELDTLAL